MDLKTAGIFILLCVPFILGTIWGTVSAAQRVFGSTGKKALWLFIAVIPFIGFIIYLLFGLRLGKKMDSE